MTVAQLAGHRIWMPGIAPGTEWGAYYDDLVAEFGLTIEVTGPNFGSDALLDTISDTPALATFMGEHTRLIWPADHGLRRIPVTNPTPVYPHSLLWHRDNPHPALAALRTHLAATTALPRNRRDLDTGLGDSSLNGSPPVRPAPPSAGGQRRASPGASRLVSPAIAPGKGFEVAADVLRLLVPGLRHQHQQRCTLLAEMGQGGVAVGLDQATAPRTFASGDLRKRDH